MHDPAVIQTRSPIWEALSEFFLDTELGDKDYLRISQVLAASPYSVKEVEDILRFEVYPVLIDNLQSPAGGWEGFDTQWLREQIEPKLNKRPLIRRPLFLWWMVRPHWDRVSTLMTPSRD